MANERSARIYGGLAPDERRAQRRERLLDAGLELLGTAGWQATTVTAVCERARLTPRYFYESFETRDELLVAIFDAIVAEVVDEARTAAAAASPDVRVTVRSTIAAWVKVATDDPRKGRVAFVEALGSERLMRRRLDTTRSFADLMSSQVRGEPGPAAREDRALEIAGLVVAGALIETMIEWLEGRLDVTAEELIEHYTEICAASLEAARAPRPRPPRR
jgi:AcrR family transcriptional regulator